MYKFGTAVTGSLVAAVLALSTPAHAQLLGGDGGLLGGSGGSSDSLLGVVGGSDSGALVTLGSGSAGDSGLVNVGLGGGGGNVLDANVGGSGGSLASADVSLGGSTLLGVNAEVGGLAGVSVNVGGSDLLSVDVDVGGTPNTGGPLFNRINVPQGAVQQTTAALGRSGGGGAGGTGISCGEDNPNDLVDMFNSSDMGGWDSATNVQLVSNQACSEARGAAAEFLAKHPPYQQMIRAVAADPLINAALARGNYQPGHVLSVQQKGRTLLVYVF